MAVGEPHLDRVAADISGGTSERTTQPVGGPASPHGSAESMPQEGSLLDGRYELREVIGRGGMAMVHRARDRQLGRDVAVKIFRPGTDIDDADDRQRREVRLLSALNHPGLVSVFDAQVGDVGDVGRPGGPAYLVTELVDGPTLAQQIKTATLTEQQVARMGVALGNALAYIHERGIVHRDIKPANILMAGTDPVPKLADFGIAVTVGSTRLTMDGLTLGTANYLSPEQVCGQAVTPASDVYSLGLVLMEALTGDLAFPGNGLEAALARLNRAPNVPRQAGRELRAVLGAMTARDPRLRPRAGQAARTLEKLYAPQPIDIAPTEEGRSLTSEILQLGQVVTEPAERPVAVIEAAASATRRAFVAAASAMRRFRRRVIIGATAVLLVATCVALVSAVAFGSAGTRQPTRVNRQAQQAIPPVPVHPQAKVTQADAPPATAQRQQQPAPAPARIVAVTASTGKKSGKAAGDGEGRSGRAGHGEGKGHGSGKGRR